MGKVPTVPSLNEAVGSEASLKVPSPQSIQQSLLAALKKTAVAHREEEAITGKLFYNASFPPLILSKKIKGKKALLEKLALWKSRDDGEEEENLARSWAVFLFISLCVCLNVCMCMCMSVVGVCMCS